MLQTIPEKLNYANGIYLRELELNKLTEAINLLADLIKAGTLNEENKARCEALVYKLYAKYYTVKYFDGGYLEEDYLLLSKFIMSCLEKLKTRNYPKTKELIDQLKIVSEKVHEFMNDAVSLIIQIKDAEGNINFSDKEVLNKVTKAFEEKIEKASSLPDTKTLFGQYTKMLDIKQCVINDLTNEYNLMKDTQARISNEEIDSFVKSFTNPLESEAGDKFCNIDVPLFDESKVFAHTLLLCTPLIDELIFYVREFSNRKNIKFICLKADVLKNKSLTFLKKLFDRFHNEGYGLLIFNYSELNCENEQKIAGQIVRYSKEGHYVFLSSTIGKDSDYQEILEYCKNEEGLDVVDVSRIYLTMPSFQEVSQTLKARDLMTETESLQLKNICPFMGYVGFNQLVTLLLEGKYWEHKLKEISSIHEGNSKTYLLNLPTQSQFISKEWIDLALKRNNDIGRVEFDYESITSISKHNLDVITKCSAPLFAKCGLACRYALLGGDDVSHWSKRPDQQERAAEATKVVAYLLNTMYTPDVQLITKEEMEKKSPGAAGLCCDGGKLIYYRIDSAQDFDWFVQCICHEVYHAFQHTAIERGYKDWHFIELGVTEGRIEQWKLNFSKYIGDLKNSYDAYRVQCVECDATAFELDAFREGAKLYQLLDLE